VLALAGCDAITQPSASPAPVNVCALTCPGYPSDAGVQCESIGPTGACQVNAYAPFVLVVTVPALAPASAGTTYAISSDEIFTEAPANGCHTAPPGEPPRDVCFKMGAVQRAGGVYLVDEAQEREAGRNLGIAPTTASVTLPVAVTFWPQWTPPDTATVPGVLTDARLLNLPLPPVFANAGVGANPTDFNAVVPELPGGLPDPNTDSEWVAAFEWVAGLPPSTAGLSPLTSNTGYIAEVEVTAPFNDGYPDVSYAVATDPNPSSTTPLNLTLGAAIGVSPSAGPPTTFEQWPVSQTPGVSVAPLTVIHADGTPFKGGWTVYLRDPITQWALSSRATLSGAVSEAPLNIISTQVPGPNAELVIEPPPNIQGVPEFIDISPTNREVYPALPPLVHVSGTVVAADGTPASATLLFFSDQLYDYATCGTPKPATTLHYEARVQTADRVPSGGAVGSYSVDLPQGYYGVVVDPGGSSVYAKTTNEYEAIVPTPSVCTGATLPSMSLDIDVTPTITVSGTFVTGDGRPLAAASVDFTPAAALAGRPTTNPIDQWPRPFTTTTDLSGGFSVAVDPGEYDITARPQDGTGLPWLVRPDHVIWSGIKRLEPVAVPAPFFLSVTLHIPDPSNPSTEYPLSEAVVQAYAFSNGAALLIGDALTDEDGHFTMMLNTLFPSD
jgi:hypothetical protein